MQVELLNRKRWQTRVELAAAIQHYIENFHSHRRRHSALNMLTPTEYENHYQSTIAASFQHPKSTEPGADHSLQESRGDSPTRADARRTLERFREEFDAKHPKAVAKLDKDWKTLTTLL
jgi:Integrase core domain